MSDGVSIVSGTFHLGRIEVSRHEREDRRCDPRVLALFDHLNMFESPAWVVFEDVEFSTYTLQTQMWASLRAIMWLWARSRKSRVECCPVTTLKKFATGHGGATKNMMMAAIPKVYPADFQLDAKGKLRDRHKRKVSDDEADALHLLRWMTTRFN